LLENVPGLLTSGYFGTILRGLAESGFDARWRILSASELGAPHQRDRLWILAYPDCLKYESAKCENKRKASGGFSKTISNTDKSGTTSGGEDHRMGREPQQVKTTDTESQFIRSGLCEDESGGERRRRFSDSGGPNFSYTKNKNVSPGQCQEEIDDKTRRGRPFNGDWWAIEPRLGRVAHGVAHRVDRLKAIGNGQVPHVAARAWELLSEGLI
jgi:DNA (cytosine-5)-methyltransferase 1